MVGNLGGELGYREKEPLSVDAISISRNLYRTNIEVIIMVAGAAATLRPTMVLTANGSCSPTALES